jgi:outer membrane protein OmpA-like peptidoglycan-associated protein
MRTRAPLWIAAFAVNLALALSCPAESEIRVSTPNRPAQVSVDPTADPRQAIVSVLDPAGEPVRGLSPQDFTVASGIRKGRVVNLEPLATSKAVPLNLVLVIDNSFSMSEREAVKPLLAALEELLKDVRPIDNIHAVVFSDAESRSAGGRRLNVKTFKSGQAAELKRFFAEAFDRGLTSKTYLYEGILAGLDIVKQMPPAAQKLMAVFSDGEDLNSKYGRPEVEIEAFGIKKFEAYAIDYMPREKPDEFLANFARDHRGRLWKARSASELGPVFQAFKNAIFHKYVLTFELENPIALEPRALDFETPALTTGASAANKVFFATGASEIPAAYARLTDRAAADAFALGPKTDALARHFNVLNVVGRALRRDPAARVGIVGCNSDTGTEQGATELSRHRAEAVKDYLTRIWGIDPGRMPVEARNLPAEPSPPATRSGRLENQRVEFLFDPDRAQSAAAGALVAETGHRSEVTVRLDISPLPDATGWELLIRGNDQVLKSVRGTGVIDPAYPFALDDLGRERLSRLGSIEAIIRVTDRKGRVHEAASDLCHIKAAPRLLIADIPSPPTGTVALAPKTVTVEEITVVDSSPLLNFVYFDAGRAEIPARYALFRTPQEARDFDEERLRGTMEKYPHVLNIIGRRAADRPKARLRIVGCNSNYGEEKGATELSRRRAEAVRAYLKAAWGLDAARLEVEVRNLPATPSAGSVPEGRAENQRVEILSDDPAILDTVRSTWTEALSDTDRFRITPQIESGLEIKRWAIEILGDGARLEGLGGEGPLNRSYVLALKDVGLLDIGQFKTVTAVVTAVDEKGQSLRAEDSAEVRFIRREERLARREGYKVVEKYALILFDFDRADIKDRNRVVVERIGERIRSVPNAVVKIMGHTDTIGKVDYNVALSRKRAQVAYEQILAGGTAARERVSFEGRGPADPLYDNGLPEGRAFNRTVTVILEYEQR